MKMMFEFGKKAIIEGRSDAKIDMQMLPNLQQKTLETNRKPRLRGRGIQI